MYVEIYVDDFLFSSLTSPCMKSLRTAVSGFYDVLLLSLNTIALFGSSNYCENNEEILLDQNEFTQTEYP